MFTPGISQIAEDLSTDAASVVGATTGFVVCLGIGPLVLAPLSETFGRRKLYMVCFSIFAITQVPTALSRNVGELVGWRTVSGFFGSGFAFLSVMVLVIDIHVSCLASCFSNLTWGMSKNTKGREG